MSPDHQPRRKGPEVPEKWTVLVLRENGTTEQREIDPSNKKDRESQFVVRAIEELHLKLEQLEKPPSKYDQRGKKLSPDVIEAAARFNSEQIPLKEHALQILEGKLQVPIRFVYTTEGVLLELRVPNPSED